MPYRITLTLEDGDEDHVFVLEQRHPSFPGKDVLVALKNEGIDTYEALFDQVPTAMGVECELIDDDIDDPADPRQEAPVAIKKDED